MQCDNSNEADKFCGLEIVKIFRNIKYYNCNKILFFGKNSNDNIEDEYTNHSINKNISEEELISRYISVRNSNTDIFFDKCNPNFISEDCTNNEVLEFLDEFGSDEI